MTLPREASPSSRARTHKVEEFEPPDGWRRMRAGEEFAGPYLHYGTDEDDEGVFFIRQEAAQALPTELGAVILWRDEAYLPHVAQLDAGEMQFGWWAPDDDGTYRWMKPEQLARRIGTARWTALLREVEL